MAEHTQATCRQKLTNCLSVSDHFVRLVLKGLGRISYNRIGAEVMQLH